MTFIYSGAYISNFCVDTWWKKIRDITQVANNENINNIRDFIEGEMPAFEEEFMSECHLQIEKLEFRKNIFVWMILNWETNTPEEGVFGNFQHRRLRRIAFIMACKILLHRALDDFNRALQL